MNIVIYSYNFFPQADPESYCSTRFASALARVGHNVTVVTMDWPMQVSKQNYDALVANELKIVRVPFSDKKNTPIKGLLIYGHKSQMAVDVPESVKAVKCELKSMDSPILVTRTHPIASTMVGLKTYKYATKWIAHYSDPVPWNGYSTTIGHRLLRRLEYNIIKRSFEKSDGISLTCEHAKLYFKEEFGAAFDEKKVLITTHIGDYRIAKNTEYIPNNERILMHSGMIYAHRGGDVIKDIMLEFETEGYDCKFVQIGYVDKSIKNSLINIDRITIYDNQSLETSLEYQKKASVQFIPDFETNADYSPFLLSKLVYLVMGESPLVVYSHKNSEMHDYAIKYPEAGIFWAEMGNKESLKSAIKSAMSSDTKTFDRTQIRKCFAEETIVKNFEEAVNRL